MKVYEKDFKAINDKLDGFAMKFNELYSLFTTEQEETKKGGKNVK